MAFIFAKYRLSKAVLISATHNEGFLNTLIREDPFFMMPVLNRPILDHTIEALKGFGIKGIAISIPKASMERVSEHIENIRGEFGPDMEIQGIVEDKPNGSAGILRGIKGTGDDEGLLVIGSNVFMHDVDLERLFTEHASRKSALTVGVVRNRRFPQEGVSLEKDGAVRSFSVIHPSRERRSPFSPLDLYVVDGRALKHISETGYFDIKEQLIPRLKAEGINVYASEVKGYVKGIHTVEDYFEVQRDALFNLGFSKDGLKEISEGVWVGENASISSKAYIVGPVVMGNNCQVLDNAQVLGPAVIGDNSVIGKRALVRESILLAHTEMQENSSLSYSIAGNETRVYSGDSYNNRVLVPSLTSGDLSLIPSQFDFATIVESVALKMGGFKYRTYLAVKRLLDIALSLALLVFLSPLFLALYIAIRLDSDGPVVFRQRRCGRHGKDFTMLKFRTMVQDAQAMQGRLATQKNVDGPMFKLRNDPRITRMGRFLRKTSLDELPQLVNVLKGEMSLVGPRPLVMDEMKFSPSWRSIRLKVKPGITGMWQVEGRSEAPFHDWIRYDVHYVKNQSFLLDLKILVKTLKVVLSKVGAY